MPSCIESWALFLLACLTLWYFLDDPRKFGFLALVDLSPRFAIDGIINMERITNTNNDVGEIGIPLGLSGWTIVLARFQFFNRKNSQ